MNSTELQGREKNIAYLQKHNLSLNGEHVFACEMAFKWQNYIVVYIDELDLGKTHLPKPHRNNPVVGSVEFIQKYFESFGYTAPLPLNVPEELLPFSGRSFAVTTLGEWLKGNTYPQFMKPAKVHKLFNGEVVKQASSKLFYQEYPQDTEVIVSDVLDIVSEYRVFVSKFKGYEGMRHYGGDPFVTPNKERILQMIDAYHPVCPRAYALDVAVLSNKKTVVVECNDFWALGTYGFDPLRYSQLLSYRWHEMITAMG